MKAIALLSGGLDSTLAVKVILEQGIEIIAVNFTTPFCLCNKGNGCKHAAKKAAEEFGCGLKSFNITDEYLEIVKAPRFGYGRNMNPCIDCRILMHKKAAEVMNDVGASFIITGEVLGQRPMSQNRRAMEIIERESNLKGYILRPLSSQVLPITIPEEKGWVDRKKLLDIYGRSRRQQIELAKEYDINDYPCPSGGCLLTDPGFAKRMRDLLKYGRLDVGEVNLLKTGRHFRISPNAKLVVGRDEMENALLQRLFKTGDIYFGPVENAGPVGLGRGQFNKEDVLVSNRIIARYSDGCKDRELAVRSYVWPNGEPESVFAMPLAESELARLRV